MVAPDYLRGRGDGLEYTGPARMETSSAAGRGRGGGGGDGGGDEASSRKRLIAYLAERGGSVDSATGRGLTQDMATALGYSELTALNSMLSRLERDGLITREVRGRRTYRIALTDAGDRRLRSAGGSPALRQFEDELSHPRGLMRACILLLLDERPAHGYELIERLKPFGFERDDPSRIYRALRWLEGAGFVRPNWETPAAGPARRVYELTPSGREALALSASGLRERSQALDEHLGRYGGSPAGATARQPQQPFEVLVEAKLSVVAPDEASARRKVEQALRGGRSLDNDVRTTGEVWVYDANPEAGRS